MKNMKKRILAALLSLSMIASAWAPAGPVLNVSAATQMVNVALGENVTASTENGAYNNNVIANVIDGNENTNWQTQGVWPSKAEVKLDMGRSISQVKVKMGGDDNASRTVKVTVQYAQNGVTSDLINFGSQTVTLSGDKTATISVEKPVSATHFYVTLSEPKQNGVDNTGFWPCVSEIEIYEAQDVTLSNYNNIAAQAIITATGGKESSSEGSANLVDGNKGNLYKFYDAQMGSEQTVTLKYEQARSMDACVISFENVGANDGDKYAFNYSILGKQPDGTLDTIVDHATANRTDNSSQTYKFAETIYAELQIVMHSCTNGTGTGWPAIAEFEVYGSELEVNDGDSIAFRKPVRAASGKNTARNITDGNKNTTWRGEYYPAYVDIDLEENYNLNTIEVYTPENGYSQYSIYTSLNGRDFAKLAEKTSTASASLETGEVYQANGKEARIIRVYLEYNSAEVAPVLNEVRITGTPSGTAVQQPPAINVKTYAESEYATKTITDADTIAEVQGIITRRLGDSYVDWFSLELAPSTSGYDYFELSMVNGKVHVKGNDGVSLATGINHYLKYYCDVNISQVGDQAKMPSTMPTIDGTVHKETKAKVRYSYNYCTLSYSMAFWGEKEWRDELDWLALNGVNVVLDATAQEEVWRRFLGKLGYSHADAKDYIAGPAYYAWAYMANLSGFGGPVHDSWFEDRTEMARKNQHIMRTLGMEPVLQGYSGMVPTDIVDRATGVYALTSSDIIGQGNWCSFQRPAMLRTTNAAFDKYAELFYACQKEVYGDVSNYYATDPFHEGGNTGGMNAADISREVLTSMLAADSDAIWIIQAWQGNPTTALLNGLDQVTNGAQHALVLDLYAEKDPHNQQTGGSYGDTKEFDETPWIYCMLNNFGGRLGLHGHLDNLATKIPEAFNKNKVIAGVGIAPEASVNNPVLYDFLFDCIWQDDATKDLPTINLDTWLDDYATRRYGAPSTNANAAWDILKETVYKSSLNNKGQGAPESVVNARPALTINAASTWGNAIVGYDKLLLEDAAELLLKDYETLKSSEGYMYDVANILQQVLSNSAQECHNRMTAAYNAKDAATFKAESAKFLEIIDYMERVTATTEYFLLGRWVEQAKGLADSAVAAGDDFTVELYEMNARALITTWGSYNQAESGGLKDYSNRQWSGLIGDFYKPRWVRWIAARTNELEGNSYESNINWFQWEWSWVRSNEKKYTVNTTTEDFSVLGAEILKKYTSYNPAADDSRDVDVTKMEVTAGDYETSGGENEGPPDLIKDGRTDTLWHTEWHPTNADRTNHYVIFTFSEPTVIDGMRFLQRQDGSNGIVKKFDLYVKRAPQSEVMMLADDGSDEWELLINDGVLSTNTSWQMIDIPETEVTAVKFKVEDAMSDKTGQAFAAAAEIRFTTPDEAEVTPEETPVETPTESPEPSETPIPTIIPTETVQVTVNVDGTTVITKESKDAPLATDFTKLDTTKATVDVTSTYVQDDGANTYFADDKIYTNTPIELGNCLYNFTLIEDGIYEITGIAEDGTTTVYMNPYVDGRAGYPHTKEAERIQVAAQEGGGFKFKDNSQQDYYLTFSVHNVFNEQEKEGDIETQVFHLYKQVATTDAQGNTKYTYVQTNDLVNGGKYVIVAEVSNGDKYVLRPSADFSTENWGEGRNSHVVKWSETILKTYTNVITFTGVSTGTTSAIVGTTQYDITVEPKDNKNVTVAVGDTLHIFDQGAMYNTMDDTNLDTSVAGVTVEAKKINDLKANLFENKDTYYTGEEILLSSCLYTFNQNPDGTFRIMATLEDGTVVYVNPRTEGKIGYPNTKNEESIRIEATADGKFKLQDATETKFYLTYKAEFHVFNETQDDGIKEFKLYELVKNAEGVYEYRAATEVKDGGQYAIVAEFTDGNRNVEKYVLHPSNDQNEEQDGIGRNSHVAKLSGVTETITGTAVTIDGLKVGTTEAAVGGTNYQITVNELPMIERTMTLVAGQSTEIAGVTLGEILNTNVISVEQKADQSGYVIHAVAAGTATVTIDRTIYRITVTKEERNIEMEVGDVQVLPGTTKTGKHDVDVLSVETAEGGFKITALDGGTTTFEIDDVIYHVTVKETQVASGIGTSTGQEVTRLTLSANYTFDLNIINSESGNATWSIIDKETGTTATWAKINADGVVSATDRANHVDTFEGYIVAVVDGVEYRTELKLSPAPTSRNLRTYDIYIDKLYHTDVYYGWIYGYGDTAAPQYGSTKLVKAVEGEVIYVAMGREYNNALDFFAKPEDGYALTQMGATGSADHYMRLQGERPEDTEFLTKQGVAGQGQYQNYDREATVYLVQQAMDLGCHGAHGFSRDVNHGDVPSVLSYYSEQLPTVSKSVIGIGTGDDYRPYGEGAKAEIGEYVYFKVTVDTYPIVAEYIDKTTKEAIDDKDILYYTDENGVRIEYREDGNYDEYIQLIDKLQDAVFITEEEVGEVTSIDKNAKSTLNITKDILHEEQVGRKHEYYVVYQIKPEDVINIDMKLKNTAELVYNYGTHYSHGSFSGEALDSAEILITTSMWRDIVVDFGLPVSYQFETAEQFKSDTYTTKYGTAKVSCEATEKENVYLTKIVYTPSEVIDEMDRIPLVEVAKGNVRMIGVYPASTVYYEEGFATYSTDKDGNSQWGGTISKGDGVQAAQELDENDMALYGFDAKYASETPGPSNGTEAVSKAYGSLATFTFTGTGADVYANCQGGSNPTGALSILVKNGDKIEKLVIVDTKVAGAKNAVSSAQNNITEAWNLPVAALDMETHGTYNVSIRHTRTQGESALLPVRLDGFRVYNTLEDQTAYEVHNEANPNFLEVRNAVLGAVNLSEVLGSTDENVASIYAEQLANGLSQIYDSTEVADGTFGKAYIIMNDTNKTTTDQLGTDSAKDLLDNGPKNELFLYPGESLVFGLTEGLENVQIGMKAVNGALTAEEGASVVVEKTVQQVEPTAEPTTVPTTEPTTEPTTVPTTEPTTEPTPEPVREPIPSTNMSVSVSGTKEISGNENKADAPMSEVKAAIFDNSNTTFWNSAWVNGTVSNESPYLIVDLGSTYNVDRVDYTPRFYSTAIWECVGNIKTLIVEVSTDGSTWTKVTPENGLDISTKISKNNDDGKFPEIIKFAEREVRYVRISGLSSYGYDGNTTNKSITIGELDIYGTKLATELATDAMTVEVSGIKELSSGAHTAEQVKNLIFDGNGGTFWNSNWKSDGIVKASPFIELDLGGTYKISQVDYTPRWDNGEKWHCTGNIKKLILEVSADGNDWTEVTPDGGLNLTSKIDSTDQAAFPYEINFGEREARYIRISGLECYGHDSNTINTSITVSELAIHGIPVTVAQTMTTRTYDAMYADATPASTYSLTSLTSSTDMFYLLGDAGVSEEGKKAVTTVTITNNSDKVLSVTDLKYFVPTGAQVEPLQALDTESFIPALMSMGYPTQADEAPTAVDKSKLQSLVDGALTDFSAYTEESVKAFTEALEAAKAVLADENATQEDVDNARYALFMASAGMEKKPEETVEPTTEPTVAPTVEPTVAPTVEPTVEPTTEPTVEPTVTPDEKKSVTEVFSDVHTDWYTEYVQYVYDNGLMTGIKGTDEFQPNANITKAQVAQVLYNMEGQPAAESKEVFEKLGDVYSAEWYADAVAWAYDTGVVTGDLNTKKFNPNADVSREQLALMMFRYADYKEYDVTASSDYEGLVNADKVNNWAAEGMSWAVGAGLISGIEKDGVKDLAPQGNASRAQVAAILQRFCENVAK